MNLQVKILKSYLLKKNFQKNGTYIFFSIYHNPQNYVFFFFSSSKRDDDCDSNIKIDIEGSDYEPDENQG